MFRCIYCPATATRKFPADHVVPVGLGRFQQNLTIFCVCGDCNSYFGSGLEREMQRDSLLALWRLDAGLKPLEEVGHIGGRRLKTVVADGFRRGAPVHFSCVDGELVPDYEPLVGFRRADDEYDWYTTNELTADVIARYKPWRNLKLYGLPEHVEALNEYLRLEGVPLLDETTELISLTSGLEVTSSFMLDDDTLRVIGKIAFNYAAHFLPNDFLLNRDFDDFREYVRNGTTVGEPLVSPMDGLLLASTAEHRTAGRNHLITMDWDSTHREIIVSVSLFNSMPFRARLCRNYHGVWFPIVSGHHFDVVTRRILRLLALPRRRYA